MIIMSLYCYYRVSTRKQEQQNGLENQTDACDLYAEQKFNTKEKDINYYCDIGSSYNEKCRLKELDKMVDELENSSTILVYDVSRLGRNTFQVFQMLRKVKKLNCKIISVSENLTFNETRFLDKIFYGKIIDAEFESDIKSDKMKKRLQVMKENGKYLGRVSYGYKMENGKVVLNKEESDIIRLIINKYDELKRYYLVEEYLNEHKVLKRGIEWTMSSIKYIIKKYGINGNLKRMKL